MTIREKFNDRVPIINQQFIDGLTDEELEKYAKLYQNYNDIFIEYLDSKLGIKKIDNDFVESDLNFSKIGNDRIDFYQQMSSNLLNYFYIRNNLHIERLNREELQILKNIEKYNSNDIKRFVKNTYKKVIFEKIEDDEIYEINFSPDQNNNYFFDNDSIVIGFRYDEYADNELSDDEWDKNHDKQRMFIMEEMNKISKKTTNLKYGVGFYNDFSVIPLQETKKSIYRV